MSAAFMELLAKLRSADNIRKPAEMQLQQLENGNFPQFMQELITALGNQQAPPDLRQLAGLTLKNALVSKEEETQTVLARRWMTLDEGVRRGVRENALRILADPQPSVRNTAALIVGKIAGIEVPLGMWPDVIHRIKELIDSPATSPETKQASFEALGFVCEECNEHLAKQSSQVLGAIAWGMNVQQPNEAIKFSATTALVNSIDFIKDNMNVENDRNFIFAMVQSAAQSPNKDIRVVSFQCLVELAVKYYDHLTAAMHKNFVLTGTAVTNALQNKEHVDVALQAIEFWSTVAEEEAARVEEQMVFEAKAEKAPHPSRNFCKAALGAWMPVILQCLTRQNERADEDEWNLAMSAAVNLGLMSMATGNEIVNYVMPFVRQHIQSQEWRFREAATVSFGFMLDGPSKEGLVPIARDALPVLLNHVNDQHPLVKDSAAWTIGRICSILPSAISNPQIEPLMRTIIGGLRGPPKIARHLAWAAHNLAVATSPRSGANTSVLSPYFGLLIGALLELVARADDQLLPGAYEALHVLVTKAAPDCENVVKQLMGEFMGRLRASFAGQMNATQLAGYLSTLQAISEKLAPPNIIQHADTLMMLYLQVLNSRQGTAHEEAYLAITSLATIVGPNFAKYYVHLRPILLESLKNWADYATCTVATSCLSELSRCLGPNLTPTCDDYVRVLLSNLQNGNIDRSVKPPIISCLGDIALAIGPAYERYMPPVMGLLIQAQRTTFADLDLDNIDYLNMFRESILTAYTAIIQGLHSDNPSESKCLLFGQYVGMVVPFFETIAADPHRDEAVLSAALGLIGDLFQRLGPPVGQFMRRPFIVRLIQDGSQSDDEGVQENASNAREEYQRVLGDM